MNKLNLFSILFLLLFVINSCKPKASEKRKLLIDKLKEESGIDLDKIKGEFERKQRIEAQKRGPKPVFSFNHLHHDFGTIQEGDKVSHTYEFTNIGKSPLVIYTTRPSCGCTTPNWSKDPVQIGNKGYITIEFDSRGRPNLQHKTITVRANTETKSITLSFRAVVIPDPENPKIIEP